MTPFTRKVIALIKKIPRGQVATYGQIAALAGKPHAARAVGWILSSCTRKYRLPWQRVIGSPGRVSLPKPTKEYREQCRLLRREGVVVSAEGRVSLTRFGWDRKPRRLRHQPQMFS
jgi:methylated-DNA-protein-cysteine methyltransferase-like protein